MVCFVQCSVCFPVPGNLPTFTSPSLRLSQQVKESLLSLLIACTLLHTDVTEQVFANLLRLGAIYCLLALVTRDQLSFAGVTLRLFLERKPFWHECATCGTSNYWNFLPLSFSDTFAALLGWKLFGRESATCGTGNHWRLLLVLFVSPMSLDTCAAESCSCN